MKLKLEKVERSKRASKKWAATFNNGETIHFGSKGMDDYTLTGDKKQRERYRARAIRGKTASPNTAASLAYYLLWGDSTSLKENIKDFKKKFNL